MLKLSDTLPERLTAIVAQLDGKATCSQSSAGISELKFSKCWFLTSSVSSQSLALSRAGTPGLGSPWSGLLTGLLHWEGWQRQEKWQQTTRLLSLPPAFLSPAWAGERSGSNNTALHDLIVKAQKRTQLK